MQQEYTAHSTTPQEKHWQCWLKPAGPHCPIQRCIVYSVLGGVVASRNSLFIITVRRLIEIIIIGVRLHVVTVVHSARRGGSMTMCLKRHSMTRGNCQCQMPLTLSPSIYFTRVSCCRYGRKPCCGSVLL